MLNIKIEKEIETKHTVIRNRNWDLRQTICVLVVVIVVGIFWGIADLDATGIALVTVPFACMAYLVGWKEEAGLRIENLFIKYIQKTMYRNERRGYHTRNGYVDLMNMAYMRLRNEDKTDKKAVKIMNTHKKKDKARLKASRYKAWQ